MRRWKPGTTEEEGSAAYTTMGFGFSFYGFFVAAAVWLALFFVWSFVADRRERGGDRR